MRLSSCIAKCVRTNDCCLHADSNLKPSSKKFYKPDLINIIHIHNSYASNLTARTEFVKEMKKRAAQITSHAREVIEWMHDKKMEEKSAKDRRALA